MRCLRSTYNFNFIEYGELIKRWNICIFISYLHLLINFRNFLFCNQTGTWSELQSNWSAHKLKLKNIALKSDECCIE